MSPKSILAAVALVAWPMLGQAQDLVQASDPETILEIASRHGAATLDTRDNGDPVITGRMAGLPYVVFFMNCTDNQNCEDLNFYVGFADINPGLERLNEWNATKRFGRAYLDSEDDAVIEMDLDLAVGVSPDYLEGTFRLWEVVLNEFSQFIGYSKK